MELYSEKQHLHYFTCNPQKQAFGFKIQ